MLLLLSFIEHKVKRNEQIHRAVLCIQPFRCRYCLDASLIDPIGSRRLSCKNRKGFDHHILSLLFCYEYYFFYIDLFN